MLLFINSVTFIWIGYEAYTEFW